MKIDPKDISVVIQGPVTEGMARCIKTVKSVLSKAEIIISTWRNSNLEMIDTTGCIVIENSDPNKNGETYYGDINNKVPDNTNRQIVSSLAGIRKATRKYVLRMRGDIKLETLKFLSFWDKFDQRNADYALFRHKILVPSFVSMNPGGGGGKRKASYFQTQISDWMQFGLREDMEQLYNIPLNSIEDVTFYKTNTYTLPDDWIDSDSHCVFRWGSEQHIFIANAKKKLKIYYPHRKAVSKEILRELNLFFLNNFIVIDWSDWKFDSFKYPVQDIFYGWTLKFEWWKTLYRYNLYQCDYKIYCDNKYKIRLNDYSMIFIKSILKSKQLKKCKLKQIKLVLRILAELVYIKLGIRK